MTNISEHNEDKDTCAASQAARPFEVRLARSGRQITVRADQTLHSALAEAGVLVPTSCREGICGTCEVRVVSGRPLHLDDILTDEEKASGKTIMVCVSRSLDPVIELDL